MYYVKITQGEEVVASTISDMLSEAVSFGNQLSLKGNTITVYDAVQSVCELELTH